MQISSISSNASSVELIETLWNVNITLGTVVSPLTDELIETLWNVNLVKGCRVVQW